MNACCKALASAVHRARMENQEQVFIFNRPAGIISSYARMIAREPCS